MAAGACGIGDIVPLIVPGIRDRSWPFVGVGGGSFGSWLWSAQRAVQPLSRNKLRWRSSVTRLAGCPAVGGRGS